MSYTLFFRLILEPSYTICAKVEQTKRGHPRINHDGYTYGLKNPIDYFIPKKRYTWYCTRNSSREGYKSQNCGVRIESKLINGKMVVNLGRPKHTCQRRWLIHCFWFKIFYPDNLYFHGNYKSSEITRVCTPIHTRFAVDSRNLWTTQCN